MAIIKGSLKYNGNVDSLPFKEIELEFSLPRFKYEQDNQSIQRVEQQPATNTVSHSLGSTNYNTLYPSDYIIGDEPNLFWAWARKAFAPPFSNDELKLKIPYSILGPNKINIGQGCITAFYFFDVLAGADTSNTIGLLEYTQPQIDPHLAKKLFFINTEEFNLLLTDIYQNIHTDTNISVESYLLLLICEIGQFSEDRVELPDLDNQQLNGIVIKSSRLGVDVSLETLETVVDRFDRLTSFPIEIEPLAEVKPAGSFYVASEPPGYPRSDLAYYHITVEASIRTGAEGTEYHTWSVDWDDVESESDLIVKPLPFKLTTARPIIASSVEGTILVRVIGFDGTTLWRHTYNPDSDELEQIEIVIDSNLPGHLEVGRSEGPATLRRIRGQVLSSDRSQSVRGLTVVLQAKENEESIWRIVSAGETGNSGYFSLKYPKGKFVAAQALVSVSPDSAVDLDIVDSGVEDETVSDSFLYLLIDSKSLPADTTCQSGSVSRLPDNADLIGSDEYSQDLGGQCVNVTSPNRTLREYSYNAIVRVSDPDVANYTLEKTPEGFKLSGGTRKIERAPIDLSNPVRWQDAPEASDELSFYQSVTVATGHILFFKSVFKADGYSLGDLVYSLPLAPGQKKQIVSYDVANTLEASEAQRLAQGERLAAELVDDRIITDELGGGISETLSGQSSARTSGFSAGLGLGVSMGKFGGSLGVAGGYSNSRSSASQSGARNISQFFAEKLRQSLMQNAESYRELNASVVTTVKEGQEYAVTTEVVANHNHCHSVTMMFFEVLRHYAISQELSDVQECVFVPLLLTEFTQENISKWKDVLATNLLPIPSNTYLQPPWFAKYVRRHPLVRAFDANERIKSDYERVDYPEGSYAEDSITSISGEIRLRTRLPRPRTGYDRIMSLPVLSKTITTRVEDTKRTLRSYAPGGDRPGTYYTTTEEEVLEKANISDQFMTLDANFQTVPPAQAIRVKTFSPQTITYNDGSTAVFDGFNNNPSDKEQWEAYANILGVFTDVYEMMNSYFAGRLISEWDRIFNQDIAPLVFNKIVDSIKIDALNLDLTSTGRYTGGEQSMRLRISEGATSAREDLPTDMRLHSNSETIHQLRSLPTLTLIVENVRIQYTTAHFNGYIYNGYLGNDLLDEDFATSGATLSTPLTERDKRNPRKEDEYIVEELFEHLNSNLEHYNKVLWRNLDPDRRYMLLDGFNIEIFDHSGGPIGYRSLASVVKNDLITIVGNALVFPVADGYNVSQTHIIENSEEAHPSLLDHYRPVREVEPYRLSVPTRGVYMESVMGQCDACEDVKEDSSQDWDRFRTEEPTAISPVVTPTPTRTDWRAIWAQFAQPLIALQTAREAPAPGAGLQGLSETLANAEAFRDVTGLAGNQENVIRTYLSNQENARAFAEMAKTMAMQEHNSENSRSIMESLDNAREQGAISEGDYSELVQDHLGQQIDGGVRRQAEESRESGREPSLTNAAIDAVEEGRAVTAQRTSNDGTNETFQVEAAGEETPIDPIFHNVTLIPQPNERSCWAAAMAMIESYRRSRAGIEPSLLSAQGLADAVGLDLDETYDWDALDEVKEHFDFQDVTITGSTYPDADKWRRWLQEYGPLYVTVHGDPSHAIIVRGISGNLTPQGCRLDILDPSPPNIGAHLPMTVAELNEEFNRGGLSYLVEYNQWRILYHPDNGRSFVEPTGEAGSVWMTGVPNMRTFKSDLVSAAIQEYEFWHSNNFSGDPRFQTNNAWWETDAIAPPPDTNQDVYDKLADYWGAVRFHNSLNAVTIDRKINNPQGNPWSAAFISYLVSASGITDNNIFKLSQLHWHYICQAIRNVNPTPGSARSGPDYTNPFHGHPISNYVPRVGDMVGRCPLFDPNQGTSGDRYIHQYNSSDFDPRLTPVIPYNDPEHPLIAGNRGKSSHIDIVVKTTDTYILAIGGNLELEGPQITGSRPQPGDIDNVSVGVRKIYLNGNGQIDPTERWQILGLPIMDVRDLSLPLHEQATEVMWDGPQTEYFVIIKVRDDPNVQ